MRLLVHGFIVLIERAWRRLALGRDAAVRALAALPLLKNRVLRLPPIAGSMQSSISG